MYTVEIYETAGLKLTNVVMERVRCDLSNGRVVLGETVLRLYSTLVQVDSITTVNIY